MRYNVEALKSKVNEIVEAHEDDYYFFGIRFEDKGREVGDICENSKDNADREDEREFPEYGTPEYDELPELNGACAWNVEDMDRVIKADRWRNDGMATALTEHIYLIAGNRANDGGLDDGEVCIENAVVLAVLA